MRRRWTRQSKNGRRAGKCAREVQAQHELENSVAQAVQSSEVRK